MKNTNKIAFEAFQAINSDHLVKKLTDFQKYLEQLCNNTCPKGFKENYIYKCIYTHVDSKTDIDKYCKTNLLAAKSSLKRIIQNIKEEGLNDESRKKHQQDLPLIVNFRLTIFLYLGIH